MTVSALYKTALLTFKKVLNIIVYFLQIRQGETVNIPTWAIHNDPVYYPNPEKFDPERFSEDNKHLIKPFTYMPFGLGPRNCIGKLYLSIEKITIQKCL